jgi:hypothetical protein
MAHIDAPITEDPGAVCRLAAAMVIDVAQQEIPSNNSKIAVDLLGVAGRLACGQITAKEAVQGFTDYSAGIRRMNSGDLGPAFTGRYTPAIETIDAAIDLLKSKPHG